MHRWSEDEIERLMTFYGRVDITYLCSKLNVTYEQLRRKVKDLGLGYQREFSDYITMRQVRELMNVQHYAIQRFILAGMPVQTRQFGRGKKNILISFDNLMKWLEENQELWDSTKVPFRAFGGEPERKISKNTEINQ